MPAVSEEIQREILARPKLRHVQTNDRSKPMIFPGDPINIQRNSITTSSLPLPPPPAPPPPPPPAHSSFSNGQRIGQPTHPLIKHTPNHQNMQSYNHPQSQKVHQRNGTASPGSNNSSRGRSRSPFVPKPPLQPGDRDKLMDEIRRGAKLRPTKSNDRSESISPANSDHLTASPHAANNNHSHNNHNSNKRQHLSIAQIYAADQQKLYMPPIKTSPIHHQREANILTQQNNYSLHHDHQQNRPSQPKIISNSRDLRNSLASPTSPPPAHRGYRYDSSSSSEIPLPPAPIKALQPATLGHQQKQQRRIDYVPSQTTNDNQHFNHQQHLLHPRGFSNGYSQSSKSPSPIPPPPPIPSPLSSAADNNREDEEDGSLSNPSSINSYNLVTTVHSPVMGRQKVGPVVRQVTRQLNSVVEPVTTRYESPFTNRNHRIDKQHHQPAAVHHEGLIHSQPQQQAFIYDNVNNELTAAKADGFQDREGGRLIEQHHSSQNGRYHFDQQRNNGYDSGFGSPSKQLTTNKPPDVNHYSPPVFPNKKPFSSSSTVVVSQQHSSSPLMNRKQSAKIKHEEIQMVQKQKSRAKSTPPPPLQQQQQQQGQHSIDRYANSSDPDLRPRHESNKTPSPDRAGFYKKANPPPPSKNPMVDETPINLGKMVNTFNEMAAEVEEEEKAATLPSMMRRFPGVGANSSHSITKRWSLSPGNVYYHSMRNLSRPQQLVNNGRHSTNEQMMTRDDMSQCLPTGRTILHKTGLSRSQNLLNYHQQPRRDQSIDGSSWQYGLTNRHSFDDEQSPILRSISPLVSSNDPYHARPYQQKQFHRHQPPITTTNEFLSRSTKHQDHVYPKTMNNSQGPNDPAYYEHHRKQSADTLKEHERREWGHQIQHSNGAEESTPADQRNGGSGQTNPSWASGRSEERSSRTLTGHVVHNHQPSSTQQSINYRKNASSSNNAGNNSHFRRQGVVRDSYFPVRGSCRALAANFEALSEQRERQNNGAGTGGSQPFLDYGFHQRSQRHRQHQRPRSSSIGSVLSEPLVNNTLPSSPTPSFHQLQQHSSITNNSSSRRNSGGSSAKMLYHQSSVPPTHYGTSVTPPPPAHHQIGYTSDNMSSRTYIYQPHYPPPLMDAAQEEEEQWMMRHDTTTISRHALPHTNSNVKPLPSVRALRKSFESSSTEGHPQQDHHQNLSQSFGGGESGRWTIAGPPPMEGFGSGDLIETDGSSFSGRGGGRFEDRMSHSLSPTGSASTGGSSGIAQDYDLLAASPFRKGAVYRTSNTWRVTKNQIGNQQNNHSVVPKLQLVSATRNQPHLKNMSALIEIKWQLSAGRKTSMKKFQIPRN